ncbi:MAG: tandem-95 repeat protein [Chitinivibrionales bacterium]|nr:tandem-95 repeat protein [Chitinivibrionales bacterium]MBD3395604.1 tandem-95 repeat protein [Chitinivibrionales bacterium]
MTHTVPKACGVHTACAGVHLLVRSALLLLIGGVMFFAASAPPVADAGPDQTVAAHDSVVLDGSSSYDPDSDPMTFQWTQVNGRPLAINNPTAPIASFDASEVLGLDSVFIELEVTGGGQSDKDTVTVYVSEPDGWAAFANGGDVYVCRLGGTASKLYSTGTVSHACWSAQGKYIYFIRTDPSPDEIWVMNNDGSNPKKLCDANNTGYCPIGSYRPDAEYVLYLDTGAKKFYKVSAADGTKTLIHTESSSITWEGEIGISRDGTRMAARGSHDLHAITVGSPSSTVVYKYGQCSAGISPSGELLTQNVTGHKILVIHGWPAGGVDTLHNPDTSSLQWDNQKFVENSNNYIVWMLNQGGPRIGINHVPADSCITICNMTSDYPDFIFGDLPSSSAPQISITSPVDGAQCTEGDNITIEAGVTANGHTVDSVVFFEGANRLGADAAPAYSYTWTSVSAGDYSLGAVVHYDGSGSGNSAPVDIAVNPEPPPAIDFSGTPQSGAHPLEVTFGATNTGGTVSSWSWDFGDGASSTAQNPTHTYNLPGTYTVSLTATGPGGNDTETKEGYIAAAWRIMPLGDSNTRGKGGYEYRSSLRDALIADGYPAAMLDYIGSGVSAGGAHGPGPDADTEYTQAQKDVLGNDLEHEGWGGYVIDGNGFSADGIKENVDTWLTASDPDIVILMIGTNDIAKDLSGDMVTRLSGLIDQITAHSSFTDGRSYLMIGSIPPIVNASQHEKAVMYNSQIPSLVLQKVQAGKNVSFVDLYSAVDVSSDMQDNLHPNSSGYANIGSMLYGFMHSPLARNNPPSIVLTAPADSSLFDGGADVDLSADSYDSDGNVVKVEFFEGTTKLGEDLDGGNGWGLTWSSVPCGEYSLTAHATDDSGYTTKSPAIVLTVNTPPVLSAIGNRSGDETLLLRFGVKATDSDGHALTLDAAGMPAGASFVDHGNDSGTFSWTPAYSDSGQHTVTFSASDGGLSDEETVTITVANVNRAPVIVTVADQQVDEMVALSFDIEANDDDGDAVSLAAFDKPADATVTDQGGGTWRFDWTPTYSDSGTYEMLFVVSDYSLSDTDSVTIRVNNDNRIPVAQDDGYTIDEDEVLTVPAAGVLQNDIDADGDGLSARLDSAMERGSLVLDSDGSFSYEPEDDYHGIVSFTYNAYDGIDSSATPALVIVTVTSINDAPVAADDAYAIDNRTNLIVDAADGVLDNDTDVEDDPLSAALETDVDTGILTLNSDGSFAYSPTVGVVGDVTFSYQAGDGDAVSNVATVTISVSSGNTAPSLAPTADAEAFADETFGMTVDASDAEDDDLTYTLVDAPDGMTINDGSGEISWLPGESDAGPHTIIVEVADIESAADRDTFVVTVKLPTSAAVVDNTGTHIAKTSRDLRAAPNPAGGRDEVHFAFTAGRNVDGRIVIRNSLGEMVFDRSYVFRLNGALSREFVFGPWDLRDRAGRRVGPGTYLVILRLSGMDDGSAEILRCRFGVKAE